GLRGQAVDSWVRTPSARGLSLPGYLPVHRAFERAAARQRSATDLPQELEHDQSRLRALEESDALRRADDRLDGGKGGGGTRGAAEDRARDLQPPPRPDATRDRRDRPLRVPRAGHEVAARVPAQFRQSVQHPEAGRPAAAATLESWARVDPGCGAPRRRRLALLRPQARQGASLLHGQRTGV